MNIIVGSVIFAEALGYFEDFIFSLQTQDMQDFKVLLVNDNIPMNILKSNLGKCNRPFLQKIIVIDKYGKNLLPYELRIELLKKALKFDADLLVLLDCDDVAGHNRISKIAQQYEEKYTFFYNDLLQLNGNQVMPQLPPITDKIDYLLECNYLGLSNCAINMGHMGEGFIESLKEGATQIFDWYLFSRILLNNLVGKKITDTCTYYRIYPENTAGISCGTAEELEKERQVKLRHYNLMLKYDERYEKLVKKYAGMELEKNENVKKDGLHFWWGMLSGRKMA